MHAPLTTTTTSKRDEITSISTLSLDLTRRGFETRTSAMHTPQTVAHFVISCVKYAACTTSNRGNINNRRPCNVTGNVGRTDIYAYIRVRQTYKYKSACAETWRCCGDVGGDQHLPAAQHDRHISFVNVVACCLEDWEAVVQHICVA